MARYDFARNLRTSAIRKPSSIEPINTGDADRDILDINANVWDRQVVRGSQWTLPVGPEIIDRARRGDWSIVLTPTKPVPSDLFDYFALEQGELRVAHTLAVGGGGATRRSGPKSRMP